MIVAAVTTALLVVMYTYTKATRTLSLALRVMETSRLFTRDMAGVMIVGAVVSGVV